MKSSIPWCSQEVTLAMQGDLGAYSTLIEKSMSMVSSIALGIVKDVDASEDVAQQVYITIWQKLSSLRNPASFLPWVRQATRHAAYNYIRDNKRGNVFASSKSLNETEALLAQLKDDNGDLESSLNRQQQSVLITDLVSNLPEQSRDVVILYYREEQSTQQVAELLGLSQDNVRQRLTRARSVLKTEWLKCYGRLILATIPSAGFVSLVGSSLTASSPLLAASSATVLSAKTGGINKLLLMMGGAGLGAFAGFLGVYFGIAPAINKAPDETLKNQLIKIRNATCFGIFIFGFVFFGSYAFTEGWVAPVLAFIVFFIGISIYVQKVNAIIFSKDYLTKQKNPFSARYIFWSKIGGYSGYIAGGVCGFGGLFFGLIESGRLVL